MAIKGKFSTSFNTKILSIYNELHASHFWTGIIPPLYKENDVQSSFAPLSPSLIS